MREVPRRSLVAWLYGGILFTLPWVGCDPVHLAVGGDLGAGFQPAFLLLAVLLPLSCRFKPVAAWHAAQRFARWHWLLAACLGAVALSVIGLAVDPPGHPLAPRVLRFVKQFVQLGVMFSFTAFAFAWTRGAARWRWTQAWLGAGLLFQLAYSAAQAACFPVPAAWFSWLERVFTSNPAILAGSEELFLGNRLTGLPRLRGTACEPLYLGNYLLLVMPILLLPGDTRSRRARRLLVGGAALLLIWTWSRGAYLAAGVALLAAVIVLHRVGWRSRPGRRAVIAGIVLFAVLGMVAVLGGVETLLLPWRRLGQSLNAQDWSNLTRLYSMEAAWRAFLLSPVVGVGWGQFAYHFPLLVDPAGLQSQFDWPVVNNYPLQILCETGIVGASVMLVATVVMLREVWGVTERARTRAGGEGAGAAVLVAGTAVAVAGVWSQLLTFSQYNLPHIWVALGLLLAALAEADPLDRSRAFASEGHESNDLPGSTRAGVVVPQVREKP